MNPSARAGLSSSPKAFYSPGVSQDPIQRLGFWLMAFYVFGVFSGFVDRLTFLHAVRPMLLSALFGLLVAGLSGRMWMVMRHPVGIALLGFTVCMMMAIPFSIWRGNSMDVFLNQWLSSLFTFFLVASLVWDVRDCRKVLSLLAGAAVLLASWSLAEGADMGGRLVFGASRYANPNDLAMVLLAASPALGFLVVHSGSRLRQALGLLGCIPVLLAIAKTGSRAGLLGAGVLVLLAFRYASAVNKFKVAAGAGLAVALSLLMLPEQLQQRFVTFFGQSSSDQALDMETVGSTYARRQLLLDSLTLTIRHPLLGVGPGNFAVAQDELARSRGEEMGHWRVTHNTYTQVSSECGLPALMLFLAAILGAFRCLGRVQRLPGTSGLWKEPELIARTLRISLWSFCVTVFFASVAYLPFLPILCGLCVGLEYAARQTLPSSVPKTQPMLGRPSLPAQPAVAARS